MLSLLEPLAPEELDEWVQEPHFRSQFRKLTKREQQSILDLLCKERIQSLSVNGRAAIIKAMCKGPTWRHFEIAIGEIFLRTEGKDLTRLKRAVDRCEDHRDLTHVLYDDIDVDSIRESILNHFQEQAIKTPCPEVRVVSDVDDTLYSNWADTRYPAKAVYPGVFQLFKELDRHGVNAEIGDIVFLTGRVGERGGFLKTRYRRRFAALGAEDFSVVTGTLLHQFYKPWIFARKWFNLQRQRRLYPEMKLVMFGDSGQADPEFLCEAIDRYPGEIRGAMLQRLGPMSEKRTQACLERGVVIFDTYVGAAVHLCGLGLLTGPALGRIIEVAQKQMAEIRFPDPKKREAREAELARDVALAQPLLIV